ncbi:MAG: BTAD domain-containing putative transcriptional regulator [Nocardioides sp.]
MAVSTEKLVDDLWGAQLPSAPRSRIQGLVSGLRRKVGAVVLTRHPGYLVDAERLERDIDDCDRLVAAAREAGQPAERMRLLAAAQEVWRGEPLAGVSTPGVEPERARLAEQRLALLEARSEAELAIGNHRSLTGLLAPAVAENPFREQLACLYITALYRSNRQADALNVYHELRERLAEELGSDVCPELRELYAQILRGEVLPRRQARGPAPRRPPWTPPGGGVRIGVGGRGRVLPDKRRLPGADPTPWRTRPAQLPARDGLFLGRAAELSTLSEATDEIAVVSGPGGLGKTALVVEWALRHADEFPDGQLFLDLGGGRSPDEAVASALVALGLPAGDLPAVLADRIGLFRSVVRDRRVLVVADDAGSLTQVLALVPPTRSSRLVVTSRSRLVPLTAHHAVQEVILRPLPVPESAELLHRIVGRERLADEPLDALVRWCGGWPLLLRQVGALLGFRPSQSIAMFVGELETGALDGVLRGDQRSVDAALAQAYSSLTPAAAQLFERMALHGGTSCLRLAAVAAGTTPRRARRLLDELVGVHFVVESGSGEFGCHDVVARFGHRLACEQEWTPAAWGPTGGLSDGLADGFADGFADGATCDCPTCRASVARAVFPNQVVPATS